MQRLLEHVAVEREKTSPDGKELGVTWSRSMYLANLAPHVELATLWLACRPIRAAREEELQAAEELVAQVSAAAAEDKEKDAKEANAESQAQPSEMALAQGGSAADGANPESRKAKKRKEPSRELPAGQTTLRGMFPSPAGAQPVLALEDGSTEGPHLAPDDGAKEDDKDSQHESTPLKKSRVEDPASSKKQPDLSTKSPTAAEPATPVLPEHPGASAGAAFYSAFSVPFISLDIEDQELLKALEQHAGVHRVSIPAYARTQPTMQAHVSLIPEHTELKDADFAAKKWKRMDGCSKEILMGLSQALKDLQRAETAFVASAKREADRLAKAQQKEALLKIQADLKKRTEIVRTVQHRGFFALKPDSLEPFPTVAAGKLRGTIDLEEPFIMKKAPVIEALAVNLRVVLANFAASYQKEPAFAKDKRTTWPLLAKDGGHTADALWTDFFSARADRPLDITAAAPNWNKTSWLFGYGDWSSCRILTKLGCGPESDSLRQDSDGHLLPQGK